MKSVTMIQENVEGGFGYGTYSENGKVVCYLVCDIPSKANNYSPNGQPFDSEQGAKALFEKLTAKGFKTALKRGYR